MWKLGLICPGPHDKPNEPEYFFPWTEPQISPLFHHSPHFSALSKTLNHLRGQRKPIVWAKIDLLHGNMTQSGQLGLTRMWLWLGVCCLEMAGSSASRREGSLGAFLSRGKRREIGPLLASQAWSHHPGDTPPLHFLLRDMVPNCPWPLSWRICLTCRWGHPNWPS